MTEEKKANEDQSGNRKRIASETLALFIVDALIDAGIVSQDSFEKAMEVAIEEIDVRKAAGDY